MSTTESAPAEMGRIVTQLTVINRLDEGRAAAGDIAADAIRSVTIDGVLIDTVATTLCLPHDIIAQLGLAPLREVDVVTANGMGRRRIFQDAKVSLLGREGTFECVELPDGTTPLLGVIPLEALGVELDLRRQQLRLLPDTSNDTFYTIL